MRKAAFFLLLFLCFSFAHAPRIVSENITQIENPEVSQAFYGKLNGSPAYFRIHSDKPFTLYVSILVPAIEGVKKDKSVEVTGDGGKILLLNASGSGWEYFYEEFGGDGYFDGPEAEKNVSAGTYMIKVYSPRNRGKYTLAVGKKEEFSLSDAMLLPRLKSEFFGKSPFEALFGLVGMSIALALFLATALGYIIWRLVKKKEGFRG